MSQKEQNDEDLWKFNPFYTKPCLFSGAGGVLMEGHIVLSTVAIEMEDYLIIFVYPKAVLHWLAVGELNHRVWPS